MSCGPNATERRVDPTDKAAMDALVGELAADLRTLAFLHDHELDPRTIERLRDANARDWFGLGFAGSEARDVLALFDDAIAEFSGPLDESLIEGLAVDYANIYLTHGYRASPTESVWFDDEGLDRQGPMFAVRGWYAAHGVAAADWRRRPDDHLVLELQFIAHLFETLPAAQACDLAAAFLDAHPLRWITSFANRVAARCETPFYAALALFTAAYLQELRDALVVITGKERPDEEPQSTPAPDPEMDAARSYVPGVGPSW